MRPVKISVPIVSADPLLFLGYMSDTPHGRTVVNEWWAKKSLRWRSCQTSYFFLWAFHSELQTCQLLLRKRVLSQTRAELSAQCAIYAQLIMNLSPSKITMTVHSKADWVQCSEDALWTDKPQAATSMRSHLKLVIDKHSIDLLFISFHNILLLPVS